MQPSQRLLILEDDDELRSLTAEALSELGHWCRTASQPGHLTAADWQWADVAIVDLRLRDGGDGSSLLRQMLGVSPAPKLLLLSGYDAMVLHTAARAARDLGYQVLDAVTKPVSMKRLAGILETATEKTRTPPRKPPVAVTPEDLRRALDRGEITMVYQPKIHLASAACIGVEALARWHCPEKGEIPPDRFVTLAELAGMAGDLTDIVLAQVLRTGAEWRRQGRHPMLSVNLPGLLLDDPSLVDHINGMVDASGLERGRIIFELTETAVITLHGTALETAARLRLAGYGLSLDDFGTGENRFERLIGLPFTELKLGKSFTDAVTTPHGARIMAGIIAMARSLGIACVAEGVEELRQAQTLQGLGCDLGQGWFLGKPVPAASFTYPLVEDRLNVAC